MFGVMWPLVMKNLNRVFDAVVVIVIVAVYSFELLGCMAHILLLTATRQLVTCYFFPCHLFRKLSESSAFKLSRYPLYLCICIFFKGTYPLEYIFFCIFKY